MAKYRKKPVIIEAEQWFPGRKIRGVCGEAGSLCSASPKPHLHTMHAGQIVELVAGDWVIPEPDGEHFYPCKPDVFANTYEPVDPSSLLAPASESRAMPNDARTPTPWPGAVVGRANLNAR